jgi:chromate reductase, NAD(P)H dehydrogenase (quinone)
MSQLKIAVFVGSLRMDSFNRRLARAVEKLAPAEFAFRHVQINDLPLYSQDFDAAYPAVATRLKEEVESADGLLFVTPEYNRSIPGVLKNAIDIASRPWGTNSFAGKPAAVIGTSIGAAGTALAQQHLRNVLVYLDVPVLAQPEVFVHFKDELIADDGTISSDGTRKFLQDFVDSYVAWIRRFCWLKVSGGGIDPVSRCARQERHHFFPGEREA